VKLLFVARHFTYFRNYDAAIRELAARGHRVHLAVERQEKLGGEAAIEALARDCDGVTVGMVPERHVDAWGGMARRLRLGLDYIRYLEPFYDGAPLRRIRARERTPRLLVSLAHPPGVGGARWRAGAARVLHALDRTLPPPASIVEYLRQQQPDALLITPLVDLGSQQIDYVRAARQLGIPTGLAVWSWDHLTSKARLREYPERVFVWNETQRGEAIHGHHVPADRVVVTGAQCFDHWFGRTPSRSRDALCGGLGLPADRPLVLWVGSGLVQGSPPEPPVVREWLAQLRRCGDPVLERASVLIRPHPAYASGFAGADLSEFGPVAIWGSNPVDEGSRSDYFDSLYHSAAVVGINTSAFIEAAIVGREVLAILDDRFRDSQEGTEHFRYLLHIGGGLLRVSRDWRSHLDQLGEALRRPPGAGHPHGAFLESFVRPRGLAHPATPDFVAAVEELAACRVDVPQPSRAAAVRRAVLGSAVRLASRVADESLVRLRHLRAVERWLSSARELNVIVRNRRSREAKAQREAERRAAKIAAKHARRAEREVEWQRHRAARAAQDAQKKAMRRAQ
jgi:hypothetical protein